MIQQSPPGYITKRMKSKFSKQYLYPHIHDTIVHKRWKQPKCLLTVEWIKKICFIHKMGNYSVLKMREIQTYAATWVNLEGIMLSEICQSQKGKYCMAPFIKRYLEWGWKWGQKMGEVSHWYRVPVLQNIKHSGDSGGNSCTTIGMY